MSNIGGNYNFGVWNPPTGIDSIQYSENVNTKLINELNNLQTSSREKERFKHFFGVSFPKSESPDTSLINSLNNMSLNFFNSIIYQRLAPDLASLTINSLTTGYPANPVFPSDILAQIPNFFFVNK